VLAVAGYHGSVHSTLGQTPAGQWAAGVAVNGAPSITANQTAFLVDFLPVIRRTLTRTGFVIDHVHYFANALKPWIGRRERLRPFIIRRDPRDISRVWVLEPEGHHYTEVPYRSISNPAVSVLDMDSRTWHAMTMGSVDLPRRQVHAGIWFRLMRAIIDELGTTMSECRTAGRMIMGIWAEAGYPLRAGPLKWHTHEGYPLDMQLRTLEVTATTIHFLENQTLRGQGPDAALFLSTPVHRQWSFREVRRRG
jgi:hypothetical protein